MPRIENEWEQLPIAVLHQFDALCDRVEHALLHDANTRIEPFVVDLPLSQQRLIVRELLPLEIEHRHAANQSLIPGEFASRFPQWAEELQELATQCVEDLDRARIAGSDTADMKASFHKTIETNSVDVPAQCSDQWGASTQIARHFDLPADGVLGHYRLRSVIGRGGMGLVVRAHDTRLTRDVAIKVLASTLADDEASHERFLREARAAAVVRHSNVVTIYAVEEINGIPLMVMELVDGTTLEDYLRTSDKLQTGEIVNLACQMAQGLAAAHRHELIHRDIKPANILLEKVDQHGKDLRTPSAWHVKITDFGLARVVDQMRLTGDDVIAGTPQYMSPEQANGQELDVRSDLFSLGSVMYAMCARRPAFEAESAIAIVRQVVDKPAPSLRELSRETPDWLVAVIEKLMSKSPDDRFQTATEVAELLTRHQHDSQNGIAASTFVAARRVRPWKFAVALLMLAVIGFWIAQVVVRVETAHGALIVRTDDPDVQISVKYGSGAVLPKTEQKNTA